MSRGAPSSEVGADVSDKHVRDVTRSASPGGQQGDGERVSRHLVYRLSQPQTPNKLAASCGPFLAPASERVGVVEGVVFMSPAPQSPLR